MYSFCVANFDSVVKITKYQTARPLLCHIDLNKIPTVENFSI